MPSLIGRQYGWKRQPYDEKDILYSLSKPVKAFPPEDDITAQLPACWDQLNTSSCTYHGISAGIWSGQVRAGQTPVMPSRLFGYYNERDFEGDPRADAGAIIRDGMKVTNIYGICPEALWPFDVSKVLIKPPKAAYDAAIKDRIRLYAAVDPRNIMQIKLAISHKLPVIFGFDVYESFESAEVASTGIMPMPKRNFFGRITEQLLGGHCTAIVGYSDIKSAMLVRNSWGTRWGDPAHPGHFWMPYDYLMSGYCNDGWVLRFN